MARRPDRGGRVLAFPPLPRVPTPPRVPPDPRNQNTQKIVDNLRRALASEIVTAGPNFVTGFPASAVDLGRLKVALEKGLARFDREQLEGRWEEVFDWIRRLIFSWVQRCKHAKIERVDAAVRIELETQDDFGYYSYSFEAFPAARSARSGGLNRKRRPT